MIFFDIALLRRTEIVIEQKNVGIRPKRPRPQFPRACRRQSRSPDQAGRAAAESRRQPSPRHSPPACATPPEIRRRRTQECWACRSTSAQPATPAALPATSRAADACAVTVPFAPVRPRVRTSRPTRNARSRPGSSRTHLGAERHTSARTRSVAGFLGMRTSQTENALSFGARSGRRRSGRAGREQPPSPDAARGRHASTPPVPSPRSRWRA